MSAKVAASILSADLARLAEQVKLVENHVDLLHIDVMDARFVPPLTVGPIVVESLRRVTDLPLHCHLQVERPRRLIEDFAAAGADIVTFHVEALLSAEAVTEAIRSARSLGLRPGLAVSPATPAEAVFPYMEALDRVIVMSVQPGWAGQTFMEEALPKIEKVRSELERRRISVDIEVDGGIDGATGRRCLSAGATVLAVASSIFKAPDPAEAARELAALAAGRHG